LIVFAGDKFFRVLFLGGEISRSSNSFMVMKPSLIRSVGGGFLMPFKTDYELSNDASLLRISW
jgi:hypothetical protein